MVLVLAARWQGGRCWFPEDHEEPSSSIAVPPDTTTTLGNSYAATPAGPRYHGGTATAGRAGTGAADPRNRSAAGWGAAFPV